MTARSEGFTHEQLEWFARLARITKPISKLAGYQVPASGHPEYPARYVNFYPVLSESERRLAVAAAQTLFMADGLQLEPTSEPRTFRVVVA